MNNEQQSFELEQQADKTFVNMIRLLAEAVDKRCFVHGRLRFIDTPLLNKSLHLVMIYNDIKSSHQLAKRLDISFKTLNKMMNRSDSETMNRKGIDKVIEFMNQTADEYEKKLKSL